MKETKIKVAYVEPDDYFPKALRKKYKLGEYAEDTEKKNETETEDSKQ